MEALATSRHHSQSRGSLLAVLLRWLPLLVCILAIQINCCTSRDAAPECRTSDDCSIGYRCSATSGECVRQTCSRDCSNATGQALCGRSTGAVQTFKNLCELRKAECEMASEITIVRNGPCDTLPPPPVHICEEDKAAFNDRLEEDLHGYVNNCLINTPDDLQTLRSCTSPVCTVEGYALRQCYHQWCWCVTRDGNVIENTLRLSQDMPDNFCAEREGCEGGHLDGDIFTPSSGCGICECLNGVVTCFEDFVPDSDGELNVTQVELLKDVLVHIFFFQYNQNDHVIIDIRHYYENPYQVSDSQREKALVWKFEYYDMNGNGELSHAEEHIFQMELFQYVRCKAFFDHIIEVIDSNDNGKISEEEWYQFFEMEHTSADLASTSASGTQHLEVQGRKRRNMQQRLSIENRRKFWYMLH